MLSYGVLLMLRNIFHDKDGMGWDGMVCSLCVMFELLAINSIFPSPIFFFSIFQFQMSVVFYFVRSTLVLEN